MRIGLVLAVLVLLSTGCRSSTEPLSNLSGQWFVQYSFAGSSFDFTLAQAGDSVHGSGSFQMEAGSGGTFEVRGAYARPKVALTLTYEHGSSQFFAGEVEGARMVGTVSDSAGHSYAQTFLKR